MRNEFKPIPFVNELGQKINPGDEVIFIASAWKRTRVKKGIFAGVFIGSTEVYNRDKREYEWVDNEIVSVKIKDVKHPYYEEPTCSILPLKRVYKILTYEDVKI